MLATMLRASAGSFGITSLADLFTTEDGFAYEFDDLSTLWQDTSGTTAVTTNADPIARVDDVSGNGYNATQATGAARPTFNDSAGVRWADFDGGDYLTIPSSTASLSFMHKNTGVGIAALVRFGTVASPNAAYVLIGNNGTTSTKTGIYLYYDDRSSGSKNDALVSAITNGSASFLDVTTSNNSISANTDHSVYFQSPIGSLELKVDNSQVGIDSTTSGSASTGSASHDLQIGAGGNNVVPMVGRIYQIAVRDKEFSTEELAAIETYFLSKI